jgi:hypothetical protein
MRRGKSGIFHGFLMEQHKYADHAAGMHKLLMVEIS